MPRWGSSLTLCFLYLIMSYLSMHEDFSFACHIRWHNHLLNIYKVYNITKTLQSLRNVFDLSVTSIREFVSKLDCSVYAVICSSYVFHKNSDSFGEELHFLNRSVSLACLTILEKIYKWLRCSIEYIEHCKYKHCKMTIRIEYYTWHFGIEESFTPKKHNVSSLILKWNIKGCIKPIIFCSFCQWMNVVSGLNKHQHHSMYLIYICY